MELFNKIHIFEPKKSHIYEPNISLISLFNLMFNYAKLRISVFVTKLKPVTCAPAIVPHQYFQFQNFICYHFASILT